MSGGIYLYKRHQVLFMSESQILHTISSDIDADVHRLRPDYRDKLQKIVDDGVFESYSSFDDMKREIEVV